MATLGAHRACRETLGNGMLAPCQCVLHTLPVSLAVLLQTAACEALRPGRMLSLSSAYPTGILPILCLGLIGVVVSINAIHLGCQSKSSSHTLEPRLADKKWHCFCLHGFVHRSCYTLSSHRSRDLFMFCCQRFIVRLVCVSIIVDVLVYFLKPLC